MLMRYAMLIGAAGTAVFGAINLGNNNSDLMLVDAGYGAPQPDLSLWVLGMIAAFMVLSFGRVVVFGLPSMMGNWFGHNRTWLFAVGGGGLIYALLYLT